MRGFRADIYPLLRFGRFRPFNAWGDFNKFIVSKIRGGAFNSSLDPPPLGTGSIR